MILRYRVDLDQPERDELTAMLAGGKQPARKLKRAQILLAVDAGLGDEAIAATVVVGGSTVYRTKRRFVEMGLEAALSEEPRAGAQRKLTGKEEALLVATACSSPPPGRARWTLELLAGEFVKLTDHQELSRETVRRRLADNDLKTWRKDMWCIPKVHAEYVARMEDVLDRRTPLLAQSQGHRAARRGRLCPLHARPRRYPLPAGRTRQGGARQLTRPPRSTRLCLLQRRDASFDGWNSTTRPNTPAGSTWSRSKSASCAASASIVASIAMIASSRRPLPGSTCETPVALASTGCSLPKTHALRWPKPMPSRLPKSHNLCAEVLGEIGPQLPELAVLVLKLLQPLHLGRQQSVVFLLPVEVRRLADPRPTTDLRDGDSVRSLLQNERLLRVRELRCLQRDVTAENSTFERSSFQGSGHKETDDATLAVHGRAGHRDP